MKKYFPPFSNYQFSVSLSSINPLFVSLYLQSEVTWNGLIALPTKSKNSFTSDLALSIGNYFIIIRFGKSCQSRILN